MKKQLSEKVIRKIESYAKEYVRGLITKYKISKEVGVSVYSVDKYMGRYLRISKIKFRPVKTNGIFREEVLSKDTFQCRLCRKIRHNDMKSKKRKGYCRLCMAGE